MRILLTQSSELNAAPCTVLPQDILTFVTALNETATSEEVWQLFVDLAKQKGITLVDYVIATDYQNWQKVQFIRTTMDSSWIDFANADTRVRRKSTFRLHSINRLEPVLTGYEYHDLMHNMDEERAFLLKQTAEKYGGRSGIAIPMRMTDPGQAAHMMLAADLPRAEFEELMAQQGWVLHACALYAHIRHMELFKTEFMERNKLTEKQREIVESVGAGMTDKEISARLGVSISTVRQRISALQNKTGCRNRADLAALAMRIGLVPDPMTRAHQNELTVFLSTGDNQQGTEYARNDT